MASLQDIVVSAAVNLGSALAFLITFAILRLQPVNDRVYFPKWYLKGIRGSPSHSRGPVTKFVNLDWRMYIRFLNWMPQALRMPEPELVEHAGLDSVAYIRIYLLGLKIFVPIAVLAFIILVPVNFTGDMLDRIEDLTYSNIDKLSISNIPRGSNRFWAHIVMAYVFTFWTFYMLHKEYRNIMTMRLEFLANADRRPDQFSVLVRNVPPDPDESVSDYVEHFFRVNHPDHYLLHGVVYNANKLAKLVDKKKRSKNWLTYYENKFERYPAIRPTTKTGFCGLWGARVDAIDYYTSEIQKLSEEELAERERVKCDPKAVLPAAFVSFRSRWGAAVCAQTQQSSDPTIWLTEWAPEPTDVYWANLAIPYVELNIRRLLMAVAFFFLVFFFMVPIAFVQSIANIDGIQRAFPFLKSLIQKKFVKAFIQGVLPGLVLKICLLSVPLVLMTMSKIEGFTSFSSLERRTARKYHLFILVNVFLGSIITGTAFQQLYKLLHQSATDLPRTVGVSIPMKATFFITYIMVDGWAGIAIEILRVVPFVLFHLKNALLVKTDQDREPAMDPGFLDFATYEPRIQLYFLLGLVYCVITPILLPFIIVFFAFAYLVFRHQIINVYDRKYESAAAFWLDVHLRILTGLFIAQLILLGLLSTKSLGKSTPLLIALPVLTIWFYIICKGQFESAFVQFPLQNAMMDTLERATKPNLNLRLYLRDAYVHPVFKGGEVNLLYNIDLEEDSLLILTKWVSQSSRVTSLAGSDAMV
ncbi:hypothetical protein Droror1_Dr00020761 [Drosera rotundifolia]